MKWLPIVLLFLFLPITAPAHTKLLPLATEQGLSQGTVHSLFIDKQGFLWVATGGGINRFDGNKLIELHAKNHRLSEISFNDILQDSQGRLWISADHTGLYLYDAQLGQFELFYTAPSVPDHPVQATILTLQEYDAEHLLFVLNQAVYKLRIADKSAEKIFDLATLGHASGWIRALLQHEQQLFISSSHGLIHLDLTTKQYTRLPHLPTNVINPTRDQVHTKALAIFEDKLYVGAVAGLYQLSLNDVADFIARSNRYEVRTLLAEHNTWQLKTQHKQLWIATDRGLYNLAGGTMRPHLVLRLQESNQQLLDNAIVDFAIDAQQGIWLANRGEGVFYWHPQSSAFNHLAIKQGKGLSSDRITQIWQHHNQLWLGTINGLNQLDLATGDSTAYLVQAAQGLRWHQGHIRNFVVGQDNALWLSVSSGLRRFDTVTKQISMPEATDQAAQALLAEGAKALFFDHSQGELIFSQQQQLYRYNPISQRVTPLDYLNTQLPMTYFGAILGQLTDNSWLLSTSDKLWRYWPQNNQLEVVYQHTDYQPQLNRHATSMQYDNSGRLWVGMQGVGLLGFNADTLALEQHFSVNDKLYSNEVFSLLKDNAGDIWFSSRQGLARLEPDNLQIEYFTQADGLAFNEFKDGAAFALTDGRLVFGGMRGLITVDPSKLLATEAKLQVAITEFTVLSGKQQSLHGFLNDRKLELTHKDAGLKIGFSAMSFYNNHKITYRYWLTGTQDTLYPVQVDSQVLFPQLSPGQYQFHVAAISPLTGEQSAPATLTLVISPPWWRSPTSYLVYLLLSITIFGFIWQRRRRQQRLLLKANEQIKISEQRLTQALASINSGVFEWQAKTNTMVSNRLPAMLDASENMHTITLQQHVSLIHPDDAAEYTKKWQQLMADPAQMLDVTYRLRHQDGRWLWFRDIARVTALNDKKQPLTIMGSYSNITETKANKEKARLFGEAFQQTRDWVVILDNRQRMIAANLSFTQAFGGIEPYINSPRVHHLGISLVRRRFYTRLLNSLKKGEHWQGEETVITPDGRERPTLINISAIGEQDLTFFVLVFTDITAQKAAEAELRYLANYDALTGLPNRALLMDRIQHGIDKTKREKRSLALCFIDLDKFKQINDSLGHDIGDLMLKEVARRLKLTLRDSDTVARLGGDEFVVLLEGYKAQENLSHIARKMLAVISEPMQLGSDSVGVSPSIGIAVFPDDALNSTELMKHADVAMYHAKEAGRNNFQFFMKAMNEKAHMQLARESRLRKALQQQEFINYYQPIIDSSNRSLVGAEVLLRWQSPEGMISPAEFIPLAEELRLIVSMTQQLLDRALQDMVAWRAAGHDIYLSVNLSTQHLEQPKLAETVHALLHKYQLPVHCLRFEITESALMRDQESAIRTMQSLSDSGIKLALDDFGTGYSSLKYLKELPLDAIKIDRSFVQDIGIDHNDETIIDAMLSMSYSLGLYCVAEGVETEQQLAFFSARNCTLIQGFLYSKPMPAPDVLALLNSGSFAPAPPPPLN